MDSGTSDSLTRPSRWDLPPQPKAGDRSSAISVLGVRVSGVGAAEVAETVACWARSAHLEAVPRCVCATSVHGVVEAERDPDFRAILNRADLVVPDGMPLVWFGRMMGLRGMERVYGPSLMLDVLERTQSGVRHFFYGGAPGVAEQLTGRLRARFPGLAVAGWHCPPFRPLQESERHAVAEEINEAHADIVWVGLSTPKQERWMDDMRARLRSKVMLSVGAAFDFHAGRVRQAPRWVQRSGTEWLFRLSQEPRRLWRRYAYNNPRFICLAGLQLMRFRSYED